MRARRSINRGNWAPICWFLLPAILLAACARAGGGDASEPSIGEITPIRSEGLITLPLDAYMETGQQDLAIRRAEDVLAQECMGRFGLAWPLLERGLPRTPILSGRYGVLDASEAAQYGYHLPPDPENDARGVAAKTASGSLTATQFAVWSGKGASAPAGQQIPEGGCIGEARRSLNAGGKLHTLDYPLQLSSQARERSESDSRVRDAFKEWSACMRKAGYDYGEPFDANNDPAWSGAYPSDREIATAAADVECKNQTNVVGIWAAVEGAYQRQLIERNAESLAEVKTLIETRARNAADALSKA